MKNYGFDDFYGLLAESYVDKQVNRAARYIERNHSRLIGLERTQAGNPKTAKDLANDVKNQMPILVSKDNNPKPGKFIVGASRIFYDEIDNNRRDVSPQLSRYIRTLIQDGHTDQFDEDLNGMSFEQLEQTFPKRAQEAGQNEKNEFSARKWERNPEYDIVRIDSTEEARPYIRFLNPRMPWCITQDQRYYNSYTNGGLGVFYFVLKKGYENLKPVKGKNSPHDEYGESMMAVAVDENGQLLNCTSRWNGSGDFFTAKQLSELLGVNFYETFLPRPFEETVAKCGFHEADEQHPSLRRLGYMVPANANADALFYGGWVRVGKPDYERKAIDWAYYRREGLAEIMYSRKTGRLTSTVPLDEIDENAIPVLYEDNDDVPLVIPRSVTNIDKDIFKNHSGRLRIQVEEGNPVYFMDGGSLYRRGEDGFSLIWCDNSLETLNVKEGTAEIGIIASNALQKRLSKVHLPEGVKRICDDSFYWCGALKSINFPKSLETIGGAAFYGCGIEEIETRAKLGDGAFSACQKLKLARVMFRDSGNIELNAFSFTRIERLELLPGTECVPEKCFNGAYIGEVSFPEGLKAIYDSAFYDVRGLKSVVFPKSLSRLADHCFWNCHDLKSVKFSGGLSDWGYQSFLYCESLESVEFQDFPATVSDNGGFETDIGFGMFNGCDSLKHITLPSGYEKLGDSMFKYCRSLESVYVPEGYRNIGRTALFGTRSLKSMNLPSTVEDIHYDAFGNSSIENLYIHINSPIYRKIYTHCQVAEGGWLQLKKDNPLSTGIPPTTKIIPYTEESEVSFIRSLGRGGGAPGADEQVATESFSSFLLGRREGGGTPRRLRGF